MPYGPGTYGKKVGRPSKKRKNGVNDGHSKRKIQKINELQDY
jgi:hypothetical protein